MNKIIWKQHIALNQLNQFRSQGLGQFLGIKITGRNRKGLIAEMPIEDKHKQPLGIVHGGATATLAETVASIASWLCIDTEKKFIVGLELNINHLKAVREGLVTAFCKAIHVGRSTQVWQIDIFNSVQQQVSTSRLTVSNIDKK